MNHDKSNAKKIKSQKVEDKCRKARKILARTRIRSASNSVVDKGHSGSLPTPARVHDSAAAAEARWGRTGAGTGASLISDLAPKEILCCFCGGPVCAKFQTVALVCFTFAKLISLGTRSG